MSAVANEKEISEVQLRLGEDRNKKVIASYCKHFQKVKQ